jgi:acyl transferase domain-containing protein/acyl carrier protein
MMNQPSDNHDYHSLMQNALLKLREMRGKLKAFEDARTEPIAIVGIGCRFPGQVDNPADFWQLLRSGTDAITEVPSDRWQNDDFYDANPEALGKISTRYGGFVGNLQDFDAEFFGIADREAMSLDPQQRLLLEVSWEALEHAGIVPEGLAASATGVFVGISSNDYSQRLLNRNYREIDAYLATGNSHSTAAGRLSYTLGLIGPSMAVDTACSSSLVAVHLACQSLRQQECSVALVGGVNRLLSPDFSINFSRARMLAADGRCKTFDARADGFVRAEGCGVVILKRLSDAIAAGDRIWAVIRGTAINQDGRSSGLTVPNGVAQQAVIRQALSNSGIEPAEVSYIEAHGTGTALGDPIELVALGEVFAKTHQHSPLMVGSVKTNLGHLEAAAGIAGLIKAALALHYREIPPHLHFQQPNPHVPWEQLPLQIPTKPVAWQFDRPYVVGVSSFGFSGTNAHVVLAAADAPSLVTYPAGQTDQSIHTLTLSAKTPAALKALACRYQHYLSQHPEVRFADVCYSVSTGRAQFTQRLSITASSTAEAIEKLAPFVDQTDAQFWEEVSNLATSLNEPSGNYQYPRQRLILPTYPFQRRRYWIETESPKSSPRFDSIKHPLLGRKLSLSRSSDIYFEHQLSQADPFFLTQHRVLNTAIFPASGYIEMALAAARQILQSDHTTIHHFTIQQPIIFSETKTIVQLVLTAQSEGLYRFEVLSQNPGELNWQLHATGEISKAASGAENLVDQKQDCPESVNLSAYYQTLQTHGIDYGDLFRAIRQLWRGENQAVGEIQLADELATAPYQCHPILLDAAFQVIGAALPADFQTTYLPIGCDRLTLYKRPERHCWSNVRVRLVSEQLTADLRLTNAKGEVIACIEGLHLRKAQKTTPRLSESLQDWLYQTNWQPQAFPHLLTPSAICEHLLPPLKEWLLQPEFVTYPHLLSELNHLGLAYILRALQQLGWTATIGQTVLASELIQQLSIAPQYELFFHRLLDILHQANILEKYHEQWKVVQYFAGTNIESELLRLQQDYPTAIAELTLLQRCGSGFAQVLQGQGNPIQLLFPQGDLTTAAQLYQTSTGAALMNQLVQQVVSLAIREPGGQSAERSLKILELGAGTGGTTAALLPQIATVTAEYTFTDLSPLFLQKAQQRFQEYNFIQYKVLDIERPPHLQGFDSGYYDFIIAANVLHATQDLRQSLCHARQLLAPGGLLVLLEGTQPQCWLDVIFGLTEGWWRFADRDLRPTYPLIGAEQWQYLLPTCGFADPIAISPVLEPAMVAPQSLFVARADQVNCDWLIFSDRQGLGQQLANRLLGCVTMVLIGETYHQDGTHLTVNPHCRADFERLAAAIPQPQNILYLWGLDSPTVTDLTLEPLMAATETTCTSLLHLLQTLQSAPTLWLVTQGAVAGAGDAVPSHAGFVQSPIWGLGKVIALEYPALHCRRIDLDPTLALLAQIAELELELQSTSSEDQIAIRDHSRYVARLGRFGQENEVLSLPSQPFRLTSLARGTLDQLTLQPVDRRLPGSTEVEIRVYATGLNLIDLLDTLKLLPFECDWFGVECAGEITRVGAEVTDFQIGDAVVALAAGSFSQYVTVDVALVAPKPEHLSFAEAATIPAAFLTADHALRLANLSSGERILIHAGATGTGMAAVILAQRIGAEVYATASPSKWQALEALGVKQVMNSRTLEFAEQLMTLTQGKGVDVVLNSLSGEFIPKSLSVLSDTGRFLEIGKRQIWNAAEVAQVKPKVTYHVIDLMMVAQQQPTQIQTRLRDLLRSKVQPLPQTVFPIQKVVQAFRYMQQAQHIGKIVVTQSRDSRFSVRSDGAYLITGGLGGLGLLVAEWLVQQGARHLVLISRGVPTPAQRQTLQMLEQTGAQVQFIQADVVIPSQLASAMQQVSQPLYGVFHAAGVLDDGVLQQLTWKRMAHVIAPKLAGAWNLHCLTHHQPLDCFVLFSSAAALFGSPGQASHVTANTFLDALAHHRRSIGLPGLSINWGAWAEIGAAAQRQVDQQMQLRGVGSIAPQAGLQVLEMLLEQSAAQVGVMPIQWAQFLQQDISSPFFNAFRQVTASTSQADSKSEIRSQLMAASSVDRLTLLTTYLQTEVGKVLGLPADRLPKPHQGFFDLGMDSLMTVELKNRLETHLGLSLTATTIFEHSTIRELAQHLALTLAPVEKLDQSAEMSVSSEFESQLEQKSFSVLQELGSTGDLENESIGSEIITELEELESLLKRH